MRRSGWICVFFVLASGRLFAQDVAAQLSFTVRVPEPRASSPVTVQISSAVEERGLAIWSGRASDFNVAVAVSRSRWTIRSITSLTSLTLDPQRPSTLQQLEIVRAMYSANSFSVAGGGGIREERDGTRTLIGRVIAGSDVGRGRIQGSLVMERAVTSPRLHRDAIDVVTTLGWSRPVSDRLSLGIESIGQDLEGLWNPAEADGGARLLVGPSLQARSKHRTWTASLTAGPVVQRVSPGLMDTRRLAVFASANWVPSSHR